MSDVTEVKHFVCDSINQCKLKQMTLLFRNWILKVLTRNFPSFQAYVLFPIYSRTTVLPQLWPEFPFQPVLATPPFSLSISLSFFPAQPPYPKVPSYPVPTITRHSMFFIPLCVLSCRKTQAVAQSTAIPNPFLPCHLPT